MSIDVVLADDQQLVREGLVMMLDAEPDLRVVGQAADGDEAIALTRRLHPDVVVMDIRMPGTDGIEATRELIRHEEDMHDGRLAKILMLTTFDEDASLYGALRAGASGYLLKHAASTELGAAIRRVAGGDAWIDPSVAPKVISQLRRLASERLGRPSLTMLTARELDVLRLMADAPTNTELSELLVLSEATVKTHISRMLMKTGSHDRAQLVALAYRSGLVHP